MDYLSTRGQCPPHAFREAVMTGLAPDGGLFLPERVPDARGRLAEWQALPFRALFQAVIAPFVGDDPDPRELEGMVARSYAGFDHPEVTPVVEVGGVSVCELFHGPTLAFKDVALQFLGNLFEHYLARDERRLTVLGATSGDTGSAAIHALRGRRGIEVFILFPQGRVSPTQERQMTTVPDANIHAVAVRGSFDDAQAIVKALFADRELNAEAGLGAINSINWARVMAQITYYFYAYFRVVASRAQGRTGRAGGPRMRLGDPVRFAVPTGNFGHIYAGVMARRMGLPIEKLVLATNRNTILHELVRNGRYDRGEVHHTLSPSMDIQVASNFERYLFDLADRDPAQVRRWMDDLRERGGIALDAAHLTRVQADFASETVDDEETVATIRQVHQETGYLLDPHSAVAFRAAQAHGRPEMPVISMATAHPAKFSAAIQRAIGEEPALPPALAGLERMPTRCKVLPAEVDAIRSYLRATLG
jgi:threonine synthase